MKGKELVEKLSKDELEFQNEIARWQRKVKGYKDNINQSKNLLKQGEKRLTELLNMTVKEFKKTKVTR